MLCLFDIEEYFGIYYKLPIKYLNIPPDPVRDLERVDNCRISSTTPYYLLPS